MLFKETVDNMKKKIDKELKYLLEEDIGYQDKIIESIDYSLFSGGKRIRPILLLKSCEAFSNTYNQAIPFALAIEMIHTYSLIHDDLPAMDNDDFRRGKLTNHRVFGEAIAILSGDGLLNLAFEVMLNYTLTNSNTMEEYKRKTRAMAEIARYSGIYGMIGGQVVDLLSNDIPMDQEKLLFMYKCKTAALIQASIVTGAIMGGGTDEDIENMRRFGLNIGLAYQIKDDILDKEKDEKINKVTYLSFNDVEKSEIIIEELSEKAMEILASYKDIDKNIDMKFLEALTRNLINRKV